MRELTTVETFCVTGRGLAHSVYVGDIAPKLNDVVLLDGQECTVTGVEWPISQAGYTSILVRRIAGSSQ